jgi:large repetitive protein
VVSAQYVSGAGTAQLVFNYTILNGQTDVNGIAINANSLSLNGKVLTDTAGNTPTLTFAAAGRQRQLFGRHHSANRSEHQQQS